MKFISHSVTEMPLLRHSRIVFGFGLSFKVGFFWS